MEVQMPWKQYVLLYEVRGTDMTAMYRAILAVLDPAGLLIWPSRSLLAVADLHLEKGTAAAAQGQLVPPWDTAHTLARLAAAIALYRPTTIVAVGDSFHDAQAATRLSADDHAVLTGLTDRARFIWIHGNHDPHPPEGLLGHSAQIFTAGPITFRHQTDSRTQGEISGHFHPKARVQTRATTIARPCFMADPSRIMLPSFGARMSSPLMSGRLRSSRTILAPAITQHFPRGGQAFLLGQTRVFTFDVPAPKLASAARPHKSV